MFLGPLEKEKVWNYEAIIGCSRFLSRFYELAVSPKLSDEQNEDALRLVHRLVYGVDKDIEALQFNTAIAKMMEFINEFSKLAQYPRSAIKMAIQAVMPFAPHLAEEMWQIVGCQENLSYYPYPQVNEKYLQDESITYVVQVNGKVRGRFELTKDQTEEAILEIAKKHPAIQSFIEGKKLQKVVFVPNKLLSLVVE